MKALIPAFQILTILGFWKPPSWPGSKGKIYDFVRIFLIPLPYWLAFGQIFHILLEVSSLDEMTETLFLMLSTVNVCCKVTNIWLRHDKVANLLDMLEDERTLPENDEESVIYYGYNDFIRYVMIVGSSMVEATMATGLALPLFQTKKEYALPVEVWLPYDYTSSSFRYWSTYLMNGICAFSMGNLSIGTDVTLNGLMVATTAQLELINHRLINLSTYSRICEGKVIVDDSEIHRREKILISRDIRHHIFVYEFANKFMETFSISILSQFIVSSTAVSVSVYQFTVDTSAGSLEFYMKLLYLCSVVLQLFLLCWFGEELALKSQDLGTSILDIDWTLLNPESVKSLLMVSLRTSKPIIISSGYFVTFSLETFKKIIKVSYTAFNVLRDSSG